MRAALQAAPAVLPAKGIQGLEIQPGRETLATPGVLADVPGGTSC